MADITINLLKSKKTIPTLNVENEFFIIAGEENATTFEISYPSDFSGYSFYVEMVNAAGAGIAKTLLENGSSTDWVLSDTEFMLPTGMAVAGYAYISISANHNEEKVVFMPVKVKVQNTIPTWVEYVSRSSQLYIENGYLYFQDDNGTTNLGYVKGDDGENGKGYNPRGVWQPNTTYFNDSQKIDVVQNGASSYYCKATHTGGNAPADNPDYWGLLAEGAGGGEGGSVTLLTSSWSNLTYTLNIAGLGNDDAIFFRPTTKADQTAISNYGVFVSPITSGTTVTITADITPAQNITMNYFIVRG